MSCNSVSNISPTFVTVSYQLDWRLFNRASFVVELKTFTFFDLSPKFNMDHNIIFTFFSKIFEIPAKLLISNDSLSDGAIRILLNIWFWKHWFSISEYFCPEDNYCCCSWMLNERGVPLGSETIYFDNMTEIMGFNLQKTIS